MAAPYTQADVASGYGIHTAINAETTKVETAFTTVLNKDDSTDNAMNVDLDMNGYQILNLPAPTDPTHVVRLQDIDDLEVLFSGANYKKVLLAESEVAIGTPASFDFDNIDQTYNRLVIEGMLRSTASATTDNVYIIVNTDITAADYHSQYDAGSNASSLTTEAATPVVCQCPAATSEANVYGYVKIVIDSYTSAVYRKIIRGDWAAGHSTDNNTVGSTAVLSNVTAAITRLRVVTDNDPTDLFGGVLRLYGEY